MTFNRKQVDFAVRSSRDDANLDFPFLPFYRKINYITLDSSAAVLADGYFDNLSILKVGDLIQVVIVDHLNPPERVGTPVCLLVQVIDTDPVVRVHLILSNEVNSVLKLFIIFDGQSNIVQHPSLVWSPPSNVLLWNNSVGDPSSIGDAFEPLDGTVMSTSRAAAARIAKWFPNTTVYACNTGQGGQPIRQWIGGLKYLFSSSTTIADPGTGTFRFNNASFASVTSMAICVSDADAARRFGGAWGANSSIRFEKTGNPAVFIEFATGVGTLNNSGSVWFDVPITSVIASAGSFTNGDMIIFTTGADLYALRKTVQQAAMAAAGVDRVDLQVWWQGESDTLAGDFYPTDFETLDAQLIVDGLINYDTPTIIMGVSEYVTSGQAWIDFNKALQRVVHANPDRRIFIRTSTIPSSFWEFPSSLGLHMLAAGYQLVGGLIANAFCGGVHRDVNPSIVNRPVTGQAEFDLGTDALPSIVFKSGNSGFFEPAKDQLGVAIAAVEKMRIGAAGVAWGTLAAPTNELTFKRTGTGTAANVGTWEKSGEYIEQIVQTLASADGVGGSWISRKARGDLTTPAVVHQNDTIYQQDAQAYGASSYVFSMRHAFRIIEPTPSNSAMGGEALWSLCALGGVAIAEAFAFSPQEIRFQAAQLFNSDRLWMPRIMTRQTLPTATANNKGTCAVSNPEAGKGDIVSNVSGGTWKYTDGSTVTLV